MYVLCHTIEVATTKVYFLKQPCSTFIVSANLRKTQVQGSFALGCVHTASELAKRSQERRSEAAKQRQANSMWSKIIGLSTIKTPHNYIPCRKFLL